MFQSLDLGTQSGFNTFLMCSMNPQIHIIIDKVEILSLNQSDLLLSF